MNGFGDRNTSHCMIPLQVVLSGRFPIAFNDRKYYNKETSGAQAVFSKIHHRKGHIMTDTSDFYVLFKFRMIE